MKLVIKNKYRYKQEEAMNLINKLVNCYKLPVLIKAKQSASQKEKSPWLSARQLEQQVKDSVEDMLLKLFLSIRRKWLKQPGEFHKAEESLFRLNGKIYISPKTGKPLTKKQWKEVLKGLDSALVRIFKDKPEYLVKRAMLLGKILQGMDYETRQREKLGSLYMPKLIPESTAWYNAYTFAEQNAAELIVDMQTTTRKRVAQTIIDSIKNKDTTRQLEMKLFDKFADANRDWRMIAETEISNNVNNGIFLSELEDIEPGEPVFMIGVTAGNACKHCVRLVKGKVVVLLAESTNKNYYKYNGKSYPILYPGSSNYGKKSIDYTVASTIHPNCYSSDTEVLTNNGWKYFKDVEENDLIMSINPKTKEVDYVPFKKKVRYKYKGDMIHFRGTSYDLLVTPEHTMLYSSLKDETLQEATAIELFNKASYRLPRSIGIWKKGRIDKVAFKFFKDRNISIQTAVRLWAWFLSEGCYIRNGSSQVNGKRKEYFRITLSQKNPNIIYEDLVELKDYLKVLKDTISIFDKELVSLFKDYYKIKSGFKYIPNFIKSLPTNLLNVFITTYVKGDGSVNSTKGWGGKTSKTTSISTSSKKLADDINEIIIKVGKAPSQYINKQKGKINNIKGRLSKSNFNIHQINICSRRFRRIDRNYKFGRHPEKIKYNDYVYDVELEKWHHLLVRRNGKVAWSGNCRCSWTRFYPEMELLLNKSKIYPVGTIRLWRGKRYQKTAKGWRLCRKHSNEKAKEQFHQFMQAQIQEMKKYRDKHTESNYFDWIKKYSESFRNKWESSYATKSINLYLEKSTDVLLQSLVRNKLGVS